MGEASVNCTDIFPLWRDFLLTWRHANRLIDEVSCNQESKDGISRQGTLNRAVMFSKAVSYDLFWDSTAVEAVDESQRWILTAMRKHGQELITMLWRILGNDQDVCDAYQTTFLRLAHHEDGLKPRWVKAYLFRTASNAAISMLRQRMAERKVLSGAAPTADDVQDVEIDVNVKHLAESLRCHVAQLPDHLRSAIMLRDFGELSYAEVARVMGISVGTARVYRCKAVQLLASQMNNEDEQ
jgi:RNA polymerase sigma factor (sigma-70 family)